jgi:hypothetical protein
MSILNRLGMGRWVAAYKKKSILRSGAVGLLSVTGDTPEVFFNAGRALQRVWLMATLNDVVVHPISNLPSLLMRRRWEGENAIPHPARDAVQRSEAFASEVFPAVSEGKETLVLLLRFGKARPVNAGTFRRPVASFEEPGGKRRGSGRAGGLK